MAKSKGGLGRGLGALIPGADEGVDSGAVRPASATGAVEIRVTAIEPNPWQPRHSMSEDSLRELADSIRAHGLIQPVIVSRVSSGAHADSIQYQLIAGERRWQAARLAGLDTVPAIVKDATPQEMLELALVENLQRADLNPLEEALAYRQLMTEFRLTQEQVAERVGKSRAAVANAVRLLRLPDKIKTCLANQDITEGHARALLSLEDEARQLAALQMVLQKGFNVRQTEELVRRMSEPPAQTSEAAPVPPEQRALEDDFRQALGTKVRLQRSKEGGGRLIVQFYSEEELQAVYEIVMRGKDTPPARR
jgi:ParB family transcriptional regulator, chromosome partitioning protein